MPECRVCRSRRWRRSALQLGDRSGGLKCRTLPPASPTWLAAAFPLDISSVTACHGTDRKSLSRAVAKPYRNADISHTEPPFLNDDGHVDFAPGDIENPKNWSLGRRSYVTVCAVLLVTNATFASSSPSGCFQSISEYFHVSIEAAGLTLTLFLLGYVAGPLVFAPLSEFYGRRYIFYITFLLYLVFNFLCAFAPNFAGLLVGRFLTGTFVSAPLSNAPGVLADLWQPVERGVAMALFSCMVWTGPALGPVISGFLNLTEDWRWSFYVLLWLGGVTALFMFTIPETYAPVVLLHKARRIRAARIPGYEEVKAPIETGDRTLVGIYKVALVRPWIILFDPISFLCAIYISVVYLLLYMLFSIYPIVFQEKRGWNSGVGELPLIGTVVGAVIGSVVVYAHSRREARRIAAGQELTPEDRLVLAMAGGVGFAVCMFWLAWTGEYNSIHWIAFTLAGTFLATSMMFIFVGFLNYLVDAYLMYAASAIAANTVTRSAAGAAAPLFTNAMFTRMGVGGGGSLIGGVAVLLAVIPFAFYRYGEGDPRAFAVRANATGAEAAQRRRRRGAAAEWAERGGADGVVGTGQENGATVDEAGSVGGQRSRSSSSTVAGASESDQPAEGRTRAGGAAARSGHDDDDGKSGDLQEKDPEVRHNERGEPPDDTALFNKEEAGA